MVSGLITFVTQTVLNKVLATAVTAGVGGAVAQTVASSQSTEEVLLAPIVTELLILFLPRLADSPNLVEALASVTAFILSSLVVGTAGYFKKESSLKLGKLTF